jgi:hypothetical protein
LHSPHKAVPLARNSARENSDPKIRNRKAQYRRDTPDCVDSPACALGRDRARDTSRFETIVSIHTIRRVAFNLSPIVADLIVLAIIVMIVAGAVR